MADEEDFSSLSLTDRWVHKNWKVRKEAYESGKAEFNKATGSEPILKDFTHDAGLWKSAAADANVAAQQEGLAALCAFLEIAGTQGCTRTRAQTIVPIVEKGLTGRPDAKKSGLEALMLYIELDKPDPVIEEMLPLLAHKQPKIIAATLSALSSLVHAYGCKTIEPKVLVKLLPKAYGHADKNVRAEAQALTVELYRWLKEAMKPLFWDDLKPVQQQDLEKLFEKVKDDPPPKQDRLLRSQQAAAEARAQNTSTPQAEHPDGPTPNDPTVAEQDDPEIDLEPDHVAVDAFKNVPADFQERIASAKWKDRKDALDELYAAVNVPLLEEGPFDDVIRACAKSMKDANVAVVAVAANCVACIAQGLRRSFAKYRSIILAPMLERFKEKKQSVTDALAAACDAVFLATGLTDVLDETLEFLKHKNPQVKLQAAEFLKRALKVTKQAPQLPEVKSLAEAAVKLLSDSQETTRTAGAEVLGVLWKIMGDRNMLSHLEGVDDARKTKIKEFCDQADVKAKWKPKPAPVAKAAAPLANVKTSSTRRPVVGVKRTAAPPAARAASPFDENPTSVPPAGPRQVKPASKFTGLKTPALKKPGLARPGSLVSPKRAATSTPAKSEDHQGAQQPRGLPAPNRGLAARSLAKPTTGSTSEPSTELFAATSNPTTSFAELAELADLRAEVELLRHQNASLRADKVRLQSEVHEMQDKHAQLIEDNTRVTLSNKAKETQLIRSRFDMEEIDEKASNLSRDNDRLKREIQRLEREGSGTNGDTNSRRANGRAETTTPALTRPAHGFNRTAMSRPKPASTTEGDAGKENYLAHDREDDAKRLNTAAPTDVLGQRGDVVPDRSTAARGMGSAADPSAAAGRASSMSSTASRSSSLNRSQTEGGIEGWKRAAEVTQNLKARIELMKSKQQAAVRRP